MARGSVYIIINKETGHKYIDTTLLPLNKEWQNHIQSANRMSTKLLHRAFRQYGLHKFMIKQIDECEEEQLEEKQYYWMQQYNPEYNENKSIKKVIEPEPEPEPEQINPIKEKKSTWRQIQPEEQATGKCCSIRIMGINVETGETKEWENSRMAALEITGDIKKGSNILLSARKGYMAYGYRWKLLEHKTLKKPVKGVHKKTWVEVHYESISEAIREMGGGSKGSGLIKSLKHPYKYSWKGFLWFYE